MNGKHFDVKDLKREFERGERKGAVRELEKLENINKLYCFNREMLKGYIFDRKRLLFLEGEK